MDYDEEIEDRIRSSPPRSSVRVLQELPLHAAAQPAQPRKKAAKKVASAWLEDLEEDDVRRIVEDLPADAASRRRPKKKKIREVEASDLAAFFEASLRAHEEGQRSLDGLSNRAERRHERLSFLEEEARGILLQVRMKSVHPTSPVALPHRRRSSSVQGPRNFSQPPVRAELDFKVGLTGAREDGESRSLSPPAGSAPPSRSRSPPSQSGALLFWSTRFREGLRRVCKRQSSPDASGGLPKFAFEETFSSQLTSQKVEQGRQRAVSVVAYYPEVFRDLRLHAFGVSEESFMHSMCDGPLSGGQQGEGKSGMLFFSSWDKKYLAKTVMQKEIAFFVEHLVNYHSHMRGCLSSFLPRFMGLYSLQFPKERVPAYLVVFENLFPAGLKFEAKYDLKGVLGSHRYVTAEQRASGVEVLKDRNFLERQPLRLASPELLAQMEKDVDFLEQHGRIDYSLLLGVSVTSEEKLQAGSSGSSGASGIRTISADGKEGEVLYMGIIDILQEYTNTKAMESRLKSFQYSLKKNFRRQSNVSDVSTAVSSMPPSHYAKRFLDFMRQIFR